MRNDPGLPDDSGPDEGPQTPLPAIADLSTSFHATMACLLDAALEANDWGGVEAETGWDLVSLLTREHRLPEWRAWQVASVADRLEAVPAVAQRFRAAVLTFDQLAAFVKATRTLNGRPLTTIDEEAASLADALAASNRSHAWVDEIITLVDDLRASGHANRQERRAERGEWMSAQQDFDGGGDKVNFQLACTALEHQGDHTERSRGRRWAHAFVDMCLATLTGGTEAGCAEHDDPGDCDDDCTAITSGRRRPARPLVTIHLDLATATVDRCGQLLRVVTGPGRSRLPTISARLLDLLGRHADLIVQLQDGANPLAEIKDTTEDVPAAIRRAVLARDRGCRAPGCRRPARHVHHIIHREHGGDHDPTNLLSLCTFHHLTWLHRRGWTPNLDPTTAKVTWTHRTSRTVATMPHGHRPAPARDPALLPDWLAPPRPPPPEHSEPPDLDRPPGSWLDPPHDQHLGDPPGGLDPP
jgi:hypothetical protein